MKRLFCLILCTVLLCCVSAPALADVVWEPDGNAFYNEHYSECTYLDGTFVANGPDGYVSVCVSPEDNTRATAFTNGVDVYVGYTWTAGDGTVWGIVEYETQGDNSAVSVWSNGETGWVDMAQMTRLYDANQFWSDHQAEFTTYDAAQSVSLDLAPLVLWTYPGSGVSAGTIDPSLWGWTPEDEPAYYNSWTDEQGQTWVYIDYYYNQSGWICLSDPKNETLPASVPTPSATIIPAAAPADGLSSGTILIIALVAIVVIAAAVLLIAVSRKGRGAPKHASPPQDRSGDDKTGSGT